MGKPVAGRNKFPFGVHGITVNGVAYKDGTTDTDIKISKQRSINVFDLLSVDGKTMFTFMDLTPFDKDGVPLDKSKTDAELVQKLKPGSFYLRAIDHEGNDRGFIIRIMSNKVTVYDGITVYDWDITAEKKIMLTGIALNKSTTSLGLSSSETLLVIYTPPNATNKTIAWTSSNPAAVTVDSTGKITAVGAGSSTITATSEDGGYTATCTVTVTIPATGVTLNKSTSALKVGVTEQLSATVAPANATNKNVTWSTSASEVATVDSTGKVTAVGNGTAVIIAKTVDGNKTANCTYTVTTAVTGVSLNKTTGTGLVGGTDKLTATVLPATASNKNVNWSSSAPASATVDSTGLVTFISNGQPIITATTVDGSKTATCTYTITTAVSSVTLAPETFELSLSGTKTQSLTMQVLPSTANNKQVNYKSSDETVATVSSVGLVTAVGEGTATITVTTVDGNKTASSTVTVVA